jgi:hypothetical protein
MAWVEPSTIQFQGDERKSSENVWGNVRYSAPLCCYAHIPYYYIHWCCITGELLWCPSHTHPPLATQFSPIGTYCILTVFLKRIRYCSKENSYIMCYELRLTTACYYYDIIKQNIWCLKMWLVTSGFSCETEFEPEMTQSWIKIQHMSWRGDTPCHRHIFLRYAQNTIDRCIPSKDVQYVCHADICLTTWPDKCSFSTFRICLW